MRLGKTMGKFSISRGFTIFVLLRLITMESLKELYKIGTGPSSSHTMGPKKAAEAFVKRASDADRYKVTLYGSLAATGKGHMTDVAILSVLEPVAPTEIVWRPDISLPFHPGMRFEAFKAGKPWTMGDLQRRRGALANEENAKNPPANIYPMTHISEILSGATARGKPSGSMSKSAKAPESGIISMRFGPPCAKPSCGADCRRSPSGRTQSFPQGQHLPGQGRELHRHAALRAKLYAYALATAEENASGGTVVTAPTCGSSAVMPAVLYHLVNTRNFASAHPACPGYGRTVRQRRQNQLVDLRRRSRLPGRGRRRLRHGCRRSLPAFRRHSRRSSMRRKWASNTTWDLRATRFADWCRSPASSATPSPQPVRSTPTAMPTSRTATT